MSDKQSHTFPSYAINMYHNPSPFELFDKVRTGLMSVAASVLTLAFVLSKENEIRSLITTYREFKQKIQ